MRRNSGKSAEHAERGRFNDYLGQHKLRRTQERNRILREIFSIHDHFDVETLLFRLRKKGQLVSRATIYRTLKHLLDSKLVRQVDLGRNRAYYEHALGRQHHEHLVCIACGKVIEFSTMTMEKLRDLVCEEFNFTPVRHSYQILGYCESCQAPS
ncbi:MAG: transcriptional repressor [Acidobacteriota bacterium]